MLCITKFWAIILVISLVLALPALRSKRLCEYLWGIFVVPFGVLLPLYVFGLSSFLIPEWKGGCKYGWLDCFECGKLALSPIVLWATGTLYAVELKLIKRPARRHIILSLFLGMVVAGGCFCYLLIYEVGEFKERDVWPINLIDLLLLCPLYISIWHGVRMFQLRTESKCRPRDFIAALAGSVPFWIGGVIWSQRIFKSLPDKAPDGNCFVVTAASHGHPNFVGPFALVRRNGKLRSANRQLVTFWHLEDLWSRRLPRCHAAFRLVYNRLGPILARRIHSPWVADLAFAALKPFEWLAVLVCFSKTRQNKRSGGGHGWIRRKALFQPKSAP